MVVFMFSTGNTFVLDDLDKSVHHGENVCIVATYVPVLVEDNVLEPPVPCCALNQVCTIRLLHKMPSIKYISPSFLPPQLGYRATAHSNG